MIEIKAWKRRSRTNGHCISPFRRLWEANGILFDWKNADGTYGLEATDGSTTIFRPVTAKEEDQVKAINKGNGVYENTTAGATTT